VTTDGDAVTVAFSGELDISRADDVERELERLEAEGPSLLVLDLRGLEFLDSTGLRIILSADSRARRGGRRVVIVPGPESGLRVEVTDRGPGFEPGSPLPSMYQDSGWGLYLVEQIADRWGVKQEEGTCVWFEVDLS